VNSSDSLRKKGEKIMSSRFHIKKTDCRGFTLIELMVVIVILGILAGLIIPRIMGRPEEAKELKAKMQIESIETALKLYKLDNGAYPDTEQGLQALVEKPDTGTLPKKWRTGGYLEKGKVPKDPWGNDFIYLSPGAHGDYDIISYGADGVQGGEDKNKDINSWEIE
jgi:general secretion pathway protein G